jgi:hypothetical protein
LGGDHNTAYGGEHAGNAEDVCTPMISDSDSGGKRTAA